MTEDSIHIVDSFIPFFIRNKDQRVFFSILETDRERYVLLNTKHNVIEVSYFTGKYTSNNKYEIHKIDRFGASYEALDALFGKYKDDKVILHRLAKFCLHSKCKSYWDYRLKGSDLATEIMAIVLGGK